MIELSKFKDNFKGQVIAELVKLDIQLSAQRTVLFGALKILVPEHYEEIIKTYNDEIEKGFNEFYLKVGEEGVDNPIDEWLKSQFGDKQ